MRSALSNFPAAGASHAGQLLSQLFDGSEKEARGQFLTTVTEIKPSDAYQTAFERWKAATQPTITATTSGPLAIGLGNASPTEVGLTLHRTYGVPYLPGSALKGLAVRAARDHKLDAEACAALFGTTEKAAHLIWWDGWLDPNCTQPLQLDTITVHHQEYYGKRGKKGFPTDFDDPNPVAFLSVPTGTRFHIALGKSTPGLDDAWVRLAAKLLEWGLTHLGLGGKTNAGYGGFAVQRAKSEAELEAERVAAEAAAEAKKAEGRAHTLRQRIVGMNLKPDKVKNELPSLLKDIDELPPPLRRETAQLLLERLQGDNRTKGDKALLKQVRARLEDGE